MVLGADFGAQMRGGVRTRPRRVRAITLDGWRQRGLEQRAKELLGKMWAYWL